MSYYDTLKNYIGSVLFDGASADAPLYAADSRACIMQALSQVGCLGLCGYFPLMPRKQALLT